jgi:mRNA interferase MazF
LPKPKLVKRGELYKYDWGGPIGSRPVLIIQNDIGNEWGQNVIIAYVTTANRPNLPLIVHFVAKDSSLRNGGSIDLGQITTVAKMSLGVKLGFMSAPKMLEVNKALIHSLGL